MDSEFTTDSPSGLSQLDALFAQLREQVMSGRHCKVLVLKQGRTVVTLTLEPEPRPAE